MTSKDGNTSRTHSRTITSARAIQAAGMATTALAGALAMVVTPPQATTGVSTSVVLTTSSNPLQPVIDQILTNTQQAQQAFEALPYATPDSNAMLPSSMQATNYELLMSVLSGLTHGQVLNQVPEVTAGDAADYRHYFQFFTPDIYYRTASGLDPDATYELTGTVGKGTGALALSSIAVGGSSAEGTGHTLELGDNLVVNPDGTFTVDIGPTEPSGAVNYLDDSGGSLLIRDMLDNWAAGGGSFHIECVADCPAPFLGVTDTGLSGSAVTTLLHAIANQVIPFGQLNVGLTKAAGILEPPNTMSDLGAETGFGVGLHSAAVSHGNFDLDPGQALIVKVPEVQAGMSGIELMNVYGSNLPATLAQTSLNGSQSFHDSDGFTYYVVSATNPGVANWLDSNGVTRGDIFMRYENIPAGTDPEGPGVTTQVVPVADVRNYLPADTPTVTPTQFAADMNERVLSYDYSLDTARVAGQPDWVTQELWLHDIQAAMGSDNFDAVFGEQPSTPMWLRLTPALSPEWGTVAKDFLANPSGSLTAIQDNLALAQSDVSLPIKLAAALLQQDFTNTVAAVHSGISSGDWQEALTALATGGQQLGSILNDALFDPNTSVISGILNARDDLATAVMAANGGFGSELGPLATWEWEHMSELLQSGTGLADLSSLLNPGDFLGA